MDELRLSAVATRVVAWHNRHPLARRITASQVHGIGYVALPFSDPSGVPGAATPAAEAAEPADDAAGGGTLRQRAEARARQQQDAGAGVPVVTQLAVDAAQLAPDFSEDFIDPLTPRQVARFARRRGQALVRAPSDGPVRRIRADGRQPEGGGLTLYLLTAVIETGTWKSRVLVGPGDKPAVLGRRVLSAPRAGALLLPLLAAGAWLYHSTHRAPAGPVVAHASTAASAPALHAAASAPALHAAASVPAHAAPASAAASAPPPSFTTTPPLDLQPRLGRIDMPSLRPHLGGPPPAPPADPASAAAPAAGPARAVAQAPARPAPGAAAPAPLPELPAFALSTRLLRTRAEADQVRIAMKSLLRATSMTEVRVDVIAEGDDWRVVGMPFETREKADQARALLVSRGMRVQVVAF